MENLELIADAVWCPVCEQKPRVSTEDVLGQPVTFLRCPQGHPYVACGDDLAMAVEHWNYHIAWRRNEDTKRMLKQVNTTDHKSYCRNCQKFTDSIMHMRKAVPQNSHLGYSLVTQECSECHLTKSSREAA